MPLYPAGPGMPPTFTGYAPLSTGLPAQPFSPYANMFGGGMLGALSQPLLTSAMGGMGMFPFGFGHSQNLYDAARRQHFHNTYMQSLFASRELEANIYTNTFRGMAHLAGTPWNESTYRSATALSGMFAQASPYLAQFAPEILEGLGGRTGSATLLTHSLMMGGRYRLDPVTGNMGVSPDSAVAISRRIMTDIYGTGDASNMHGITAGRAGQLFDELTRRGLMGATDRSDAMRSVNPVHLAFAATDAGITLPRTGSGIDFNRLTSQQLDALAQRPEVATQLRDFDTRRITDTLKRYSSAIAAVRDIFGDMGKPNAPMSELMAGLEQLTQGGMSQLSPDRLTSIVRATHNLARNSGIPMEHALAVQQTGVGMAAHFGLNPLIGVQIAQGGISFNQGLMQQGLVPSWGSYDASRLTQLDMGLRAGGAASDAANRLGALMRLRNARGGFAAGSAAETMAQSILSGSVTSDMNLSQTGFMSLLQGAGIGSAEAGLALRDEASNQEFIHKHNLGDVVRDLQPEQVRGKVGQLVKMRIATMLKEKGFSAREALDLAERAGTAASSTMFGMSKDDLADTTKRNALIGQAITGALKGTAAGSAFGRDAEGSLGESAFAAFNSGVSRGDFGAGAGSAVNVIEVNRPERLAAARKNRQMAEAQGMLQNALSPLGNPDSFLGNLIGGLQSLKPGDDLADYLGKAFGGVELGEARGKLEPHVRGIRADMDAYNAAMAEYEKNPSPENFTKIKELSSRIEAKVGALKSIDGLGDVFGTIGKKTINEASASARDIKQMRKTVARHLVTPEDAAAFWKDSRGKIFREATANFLSSGESVMMGAVTSDKFMTGRGGKAGMDAYERYMTARDRLSALAGKYTEGDVSKLLAGDFSGEGADAAKEEVTGLMGTMRGSVDILGDIERKVVDPAGRDALAGEADDVKKRLEIARAGLDPRKVAMGLLEKRFGKDDAEKLLKSGKFDDVINKLGKRDDIMRALRSGLAGKTEGLPAGVADLFKDSGDAMGLAGESSLLHERMTRLTEDEKKKSDDKSAVAGGHTAEGGGPSSMTVEGTLRLILEDGVGELRATGKSVRGPAGGDAA